MTVWHLFIDESGNFADPSDRCVVSGVGLRANKVLGRSDELRRQVERLVPGLPWPLHFCVVKRTSALALSVLALRLRAIRDVAGSERRALLQVLEALEKGQKPEEEALKRIERKIRTTAGHGLAVNLTEYIEFHYQGIRALLKALERDQSAKSVPEDLWTGEGEWEVLPQWEACSKAAFYLLSKDRTRAISLVQDLVDSRKPQLTVVNRLDKALADSPYWLSLEVQRLYVLDSLRLILRRLASPDKDGLSGAFICFAGESRPGNFTPPSEERYLSLLEAMLVRVAEVLGRWPGRHEVRLYICRRYVLDHVLGRHSPLHLRHFAPIKDRLVKRFGELRVRFVLVDVKDFRDTRDPGFVLADFVAGEARNAVGDFHLWDVEGLLWKGAGILPRSFERTHCQAAGSAWVLLEALRGGNDPKMEGSMWPWAKEQAMEWGRP